MDKRDAQVVLDQMSNIVEQQHRLEVRLLDLWKTLFAVEPDETPRPAAAGWSPVPDNHGEKATYTVAETAKLLGVSRDSIYAAVQRGEIPSLRLGRRVMVPGSALKAMPSSARP